MFRKTYRKRLGIVPLLFLKTSRKGVTTSELEKDELFTRTSRMYVDLSSYLMLILLNLCVRV